MTFGTYTRGLAVLMVGVFTLLCAPAADADRGMTKPERKMVRAINAVRGDHGLPRLKKSLPVARAADDHSSDMGNNGFFDHYSSDGTDPYNRVRRYIRKALVGETLAYMPLGGNQSARNILRLWMGSTVHRNTLLSSRFRRIGIGRERGWLNGQKVVLWTADLTSAR